jgi:hypothetical protein
MHGLIVGTIGGHGRGQKRGKGGEPRKVRSGADG